MGTVLIYMPRHIQLHLRRKKGNKDRQKVIWISLGLWNVQAMVRSQIGVGHESYSLRSSSIEEHPLTIGSRFNERNKSHKYTSIPSKISFNLFAVSIIPPTELENELVLRHSILFHWDTKSTVFILCLNTF